MTTDKKIEQDQQDKKAAARAQTAGAHQNEGDDPKQIDAHANMELGGDQSPEARARRIPIEQVDPSIPQAFQAAEKDKEKAESEPKSPMQEAHDAAAAKVAEQNAQNVAAAQRAGGTQHPPAQPAFNPNAGTSVEHGAPNTKGNDGNGGPGGDSSGQKGAGIPLTETSAGAGAQGGDGNGGGKSGPHGAGSGTRR